MGCCSSSSVSSGTPGNKVYRFTILGLPKCGKTSIVEYLAGDYEKDNPPVDTVGMIHRKFNFKGNTYCFDDFGGISIFEAEKADSLAKCDAAVFVFDHASIVYCLNHINDLFEHASPILKEKMIPSLVLITKSDQEFLNKSISGIVDEKLAGTRYKIVTLPHLNDDLYTHFSYLEGLI